MNHRQSQPTTIMQQKGVSKAGLVVITDENEDNFDQYCFLLRYVGKKFKDSSVALSKTFFITRHDYADIQRQVQILLNANGSKLDWLVVTTTHPKNDPILAKLVDDLTCQGDLLEKLSPGLVLFKQMMFLVDSVAFFDNLAFLVSHILLNQPWKKLKFLFESEDDLNCFLSRLPDQAQTEFCRFKSSYSNIAVELSSKKRSNFETIRDNFDYLLNNNLVNADHLVYNFASLSISEAKRDDLQFLSNRIDRQQMLQKLTHSISIIEQTLRQTDSSQTCISFNGGKDCCVVLYLFYACALRFGYKFPLNAVIVKISDPFAEMDEFIFNELKEFFRDSLEFIILEETTKSLKENLFELKKSRPNLNFILMGTRRSDSDYFKTMGDFAPTDPGWPSFVRVNPILDWSYGEIWFFIRALRLPYCELYNRGYTSIDSILNTVPNPALVDKSSNSSGFLPAFYLQDDSLERNSRKKKSV